MGRQSASIILTDIRNLHSLYHMQKLNGGSMCQFVDADCLDFYMKTRNNVSV